MDWSTSLPGGYIQRKKPRYTLDRRLGERQRLSGDFEEEKNVLAHTGVQTPNHPARRIVSIPTTLQRTLKFRKKTWKNTDNLGV